MIVLVVLVNWLSAQLTKQKKTDFKPRNDDLSFARVNTEPCVACCDTLEKVRDAAKANLSGKNLEVFLTEIGIAFHRYEPFQPGRCHRANRSYIAFYLTILRSSP